MFSFTPLTLNEPCPSVSWSSLHPTPHTDSVHTHKGSLTAVEVTSSAPPACSLSLSQSLQMRASAKFPKKWESKCSLIIYTCGLEAGGVGRHLRWDSGTLFKLKRRELFSSAPRVGSSLKFAPCPKDFPLYLRCGVSASGLFAVDSAKRVLIRSNRLFEYDNVIVLLFGLNSLCRLGRSRTCVSSYLLFLVLRIWNDL